MNPRSYFLALLAAVTLATGCAKPTAMGKTSPHPDDGFVSVSGREIKNPGRFEWREGLTVLGIIKMAGGLPEVAEDSGILVEHCGGTQTEYRYSKLLKGKIQDPLLRSGDRVYEAMPCW